MDAMVFEFGNECRIKESIRRLSLQGLLSTAVALLVDELGLPNVRQARTQNQKRLHDFEPRLTRRGSKGTCQVPETCKFFVTELHPPIPRIPLVACFRFHVAPRSARLLGTIYFSPGSAVSAGSRNASDNSPQQQSSDYE